MSQKKSIARLRFATMKPAVTLCHSRVAKVLTFATGAVLIAFKSRLFLVLLQLVIGVGDEGLKWLNGLIRPLPVNDAERGFDGSAGFLRFRLRHGCVAPLW